MAGNLARILFLGLALWLPLEAELAGGTDHQSAYGAVNNTIKVVYHIDDKSVVPKALNNIKHHLDAAGDHTKIVVIANGDGVNFLLDNTNQLVDGKMVRLRVLALMARGVEFRVCRNTLKSRNVDPGIVMWGVDVVPSGVAEIARLQIQEGYAYLKP